LATVAGANTLTELGRSGAVVLTGDILATRELSTTMTGLETRNVMTLLRSIPLDKLTPARLWAEVDSDTRQLAASCLYRPEWDDTGAKAEADAAIASALRFRPTAVRRLPFDKRVGYLARAVRPTETLAAALLRALHLTERSAMLETFLDKIGIAQAGGVIETEDDVDAPDAASIREAATTLRESYPQADVDLYLASLLAMDPDFWNGIAELDRPAG
jgi:hypothetical protein